MLRTALKRGLQLRIARRGLTTARPALCARTECQKNAQPVTLTAETKSISDRQQLYWISAESPGSAFFLPHGQRIYSRLGEFMRLQLRVFGFQEISSPVMYKNSLWKQSGHWAKFQDDMFRVQPGHEETTVDDEFSLKPMNCPGHCLLFNSLKRSYRELPLRYSDFSPLHRNEASGALSGLTRVRRFHQDDGHIFCTPEQVESEISRALQLVEQTYNTFGLEISRVVLSTRPETFIGDISQWNDAEKALTSVLDSWNVSKGKWELNAGDGAFYGPKIDILVKDKHGKEHQTATTQLDFQLPERFQLKYFDAAETAQRPVMVHRAVYGSLERFLAILIDHYEGKWPLWLSPRQCMVLPVGEAQNEFAEQVAAQLSGLPSIADKSTPLSASTLFCDVDTRSETLGQKIKQARTEGYTYVAVIGDKEMKQGKMTVSKPGKKERQVLTVDEARAFFHSEQDAFR
ncbi:putative threonine--tRNA ligase [Yarrowia sp. B02]|nr:putative threonine--tRNA ligase [Yarrowia sp. B02]